MSPIRTFRNFTVYLKFRRKGFWTLYQLGVILIFRFFYNERSKNGGNSESFSFFPPISKIRNGLLCGAKPIVVLYCHGRKMSLVIYVFIRGVCVLRNRGFRKCAIYVCLGKCEFYYLFDFRLLFGFVNDIYV